MTKEHIYLRTVIFVGLLTALWPVANLRADNGYDAWLRYAQLTNAEHARYGALPASVVVLGDSSVLHASQAELIRGVRGMLGRTLRAEKSTPSEDAIVLGTLEDLRSIAPDLRAPESLAPDGYWLAAGRVHGYDCIIIAGSTDRGVLYGTSDLLRRIALGEDLSRLNETQEPSAPVRWVNEWDNLDGRIERGYGGRSIFFDNGGVRADMTRVSDY
ncbi:MAG: alpha-glucuronidase family glycosyl hydrolase, partial [Candidatus Acidiferrales bacterium]